MKMMYKLGLALFIMLAGSLSLFAQNGYFADINESAIEVGNNAKRVLIPGKYRAVAANVAQLKNFLWSLPSESSVTNRNAAPVISLPMPNGSTARFRVWESSIQQPGLQAKFSEIKTFLGQGIDDPYATIRLDFSPYFGFHGQILTPNGNVYIDPYARGNINYYISYYTDDLIRNTGFHCGVNEESTAARTGSTLASGPCRGTQLYTYRLAVACTGEYAQAVGGTNAAALHAAIVTTVNRVNGVYEKELSVRLVLIDNNNLIEYTDPLSDPFNGNNNATTLITESQNVITGNIGTANFDIGHTFSTGGGGLAGLGVVCNSTSKARGITGSPVPLGDPYDIDYVAHEIGHQFGGSHTFNSQTGNCSGSNRSAANAYEVGSGTTIQAYAGICGADNLQPNSDPHFHAVSFDQISNFLEAGGASCRTVTNTGNALPVITAMNNNGANIPLNTPFTLTATATDANGDAITYNWEGWDRGAAGTWNSGGATTTSPLFKSRIPKTSGSRTFPDMAVILANYPANPTASMGGLKGETLPTVGRAMNFKLTVRDNRAGGGGIVSGGDGCQSGFTGLFTVNAIAGTGPFVVSVPNGGESYPGGTSQTVTWSVAGTNLAPINCANVKITLSTDGGITYPTVLLASTANDGSEAVVLPSVLTSQARIRIEAVDNIFFDISNANFNITGAAAGFTFSSPAPASAACPAPASMNITLGTTVVGSFTTPINLTATGNPSGTTVSFSPNPVTPGSNTVVSLNGANTLAAGTYNITVTGTAGSVTQTRVLTYTVQTGTAPVFTTQPASQQVCEGTGVSFTAASNASSYQWQLSTDGGTNWTDISNATTATFSLANVTTAQNNIRYRVRAISQCGTTVSNAAVLTVLTTPTIVNQPQSYTSCAGSNNTFTASASGTNVTYQWQVSTDGGNSFTNITGATASTLSLNNITATMNGNLYRVVASGTCAPAAASNAAQLSVVGISSQPASTTICATGTTSFVATATGNNLQYQWQVSTDGGTNWSSLVNGADVNGATSNSLTVSNVVAGMNNNRYRVQVYTNECSVRTNSGSATLNVNERPAVTLSTQNNVTSLVPGQKVVITANYVQPTTGTVVIRWYRNGQLLTDSTKKTITADVTTLGSYRAEITYLPSNCNNTSADLAITAQESNRFFIYPIPNNGRFTIAYFNSSNTDIQRTVTIYDAHGAMVYRETKGNINVPYYLWQVNLPQAAGGVYVVVLSDATGNKIATGKVLIQH